MTPTADHLVRLGTSRVLTGSVIVNCDARPSRRCYGEQHHATLNPVPTPIKLEPLTLIVQIDQAMCTCIGRYLRSLP